MVTREDVESFLLRMDEGAEEVETGMWVLRSNGGNIVVHYSPPLLVLRAKVLEAPSEEENATRLYRRLLELNASDLVHGAYAIEEGDVILTDTLDLQDLGFARLQSSCDSIQMAFASHLESLAALRE
jgi:hypothetical protein